MTSKPLVGAEGTLEVDLLPDAESAQRRACERFGHRLDGKSVPVHCDCGLAGAIDIDTSADLQVFEYAFGFDLQSLESALAFAAAHATQLFY